MEVVNGDKLRIVAGSAQARALLDLYCIVSTGVLVCLPISPITINRACQRMVQASLSVAGLEAQAYDAMLVASGRAGDVTGSITICTCSVVSSACL